MTLDFDGFQATTSADSNRPTGAVGNSRNNRRNDVSASAAFGKDEGPCFSQKTTATTTGTKGEESALHLQQQQQESLEDIVPTDCDILGKKKTSGKQYYEGLIDQYTELYLDEEPSSQVRREIIRAITDTVHYASESEMEATTRTPRKRRRRFLKRVACIAKPGTVVTNQLKRDRFVECSDKEIANRIKRSFLEKRGVSQKPNHQQHHPPGKFVPRLKSPVRKKIPRDGTSSKLKQLLEQKRERQKQHFFHQQSNTGPTNNNDHMVMDHQQPRQQDQQRLMTSLQQNDFLKQHQQHESELIEAEMRKLGIQQQQQHAQKQEQESRPLPAHSQLFDALLKRQYERKESPNHPQQQNVPQRQQQQQKQQTETTNASTMFPMAAQTTSSVAANKNSSFTEGDDYGAVSRTQSKSTHANLKTNLSKKTTRKPPSKASKKVLPARKKKPVTKIRPPQRKQKNPAAKKAPPPSATPPVAETAPKDKSSTPNLFDATSTDIAKSDLDIAANVLMGLKIAPETPTEIYLAGTRTKKYFGEFQGWFQGTICSYNNETKFYSVEYEDSDKEDLEHHEIDTGSLPPHRYDKGTQYEVCLVSKDDGAKIGWFVGTIQSKYFYKPKRGKGSRSDGVWRYSVVYDDGDSEDADEVYITKSIDLARHKPGRKKIEPPAEKKDLPPVAVIAKKSPPKAAQQPLESSCEQPIENEIENIEEFSSESDSFSEEEDDDESSSEDEGDPNPNKIPHWTGKQHQRFIVGLRKYGLGNLEDIHEADCIPGRSFQELIRYWRWYASGLEQKGLVMNYEAKGTVNGKKGTRFALDDNDDEEEKKEDCDGGFRSGKWTVIEKEMIAKACISNGHTYEAMSAFMKTRSPMQIKGYFNRHKKSVLRERLKYREKEAIGGEEDKNNDDGAVAVSSPSEKRSWTPGEHAILAEAVAIYGRNFKELAAYMKSRAKPQISGYMKRNDKSIAKEAEAKERLHENIAKRTGAWNACELSMLVEGHAIFDTDFERIAHYVKTRNADQVKSILEANASQYKDESAFDLGDHFAFPIELYHVLNVAPFEGFDHIISWNDDDGGFVFIHDNDQFANKIFPKYSHKGTSVQKFYDNLKLFGFQEFKNKKKIIKGAFHHPAFQRGNSKKVEQHCRKLFE